MYVVVVEQHAVDKVDSEHLARTKAPFTDDILLVVVVDANLRSNRQVTIPGNHVARRAQAIAIQAARGIATICQYDTGGTIPGFLLAVVKFVKSPYIGVDVVHGLPGRRYQYAHCLEDVHATRTHDLQHIVEARRIGAGQ